MAQGRLPDGPSQQLESRRRAAAMLAARLQRAFSHHQQGQLAQAEQLYREVLAQAPANAYALHMLGLVQMQKGQPEAALELVRRAVELEPQQAASHSNLALILHQMQRFEEALEHCDRALALQPDYAEALNNRGNALFRLGRYEEALGSYERAIALQPDYAEALDNRGVALAAMGRHAAALASHDQALAIDPDYVEALANRGSALRALDRPVEAMASLDRALALEPDHAAAQMQRGTLLQAAGRLEQALAAYERASALQPTNADAHFRRGRTLLLLRRHRDAVSAFERALALDPGHASALNNLGISLARTQRMDAALAAYDRALALRPDDARVHYNRGTLLVELERPDEAASSFARLLELQPDYPFAAGWLMHARMLCCDWDGYAALLQALERDVASGKKVTEPFSFTGVSGSEANLRTCAETYAAATFPRISPPLWNGEAYDHRRIRVGYLCGEFRQQATAILMTELFELHDRDRFELFAFDNGWDDGTARRRRIERAFDELVAIADLDDATAAAAIRSREIDILVNLNGYFGLGRQGVFARRPSPVQVNYLGFPGTIGADYIDYIITDHEVLPPGHDAYYCEKVVRLPDCYQANDRQRAIAGRTPSRSELGLPERGFVFCSFNNTYKITPAIFDVWMRLLAGVDGSVLWLLAPNAAAARNLRREADRRGIGGERLIFASRVELDDHLARHRQADLFLDTLPYNAHTTASDALWAGLPLVTCTGGTFPGRVSGSLLRALGMPDLITHSLDEYEALARRLALDPGALSAVRARLAANRGTFPLFDTDRFRRHIEKAYAAMWQRCQRGEPPGSFAVTPIGA